MDAKDLQILTLIQEDDSRSVAALAKIVGLSRTGCWHRIQRLETDAVIRRRVALLDPCILGHGTVAFVNFRTIENSESCRMRLADAVATMPEVIELHRTTNGEYRLTLRLTGVEAYDDIYHTLAALAPLSNISASFSIDVLKSTTAVPLKR